MSIDLEQFHQAFFEEAFGGLDQAEDDLLALEKGGDGKALIDSSFRAVHSIKGSAGTLGFHHIEQSSHRLEACFEDLRQRSLNGSLSISDAGFNALLGALDLIRNQVQSSKLGVATVADSQIEETLGQLAILAPTATTLNSYRILFRPTSALLDSGNDPLRYIDSLSLMGTVECTPMWSATTFTPAQSQAQCFLSWEIILATEKSKAQIESLFSWVDDMCELSVERIEPRLPAKTQSNLRTKVPETITAPVRGLQVSFQKVDQLLAQLSELSLSHAQLASKQLKVVGVGALDELFQRLERQTKHLQDTIVSMRMAPISTLFSRFERVVRDIQTEQGKQIELHIHGEQQELDSVLIEQLIDPITHLVRNALDHGVELPALREQRGKSATAQLHLRAYQQDNQFVISIEDDGNGLHIEKIRAHAISRGLAKETDQLADAKWARMIFAPGFSTANQVNQWSGRGVGLDAVATTLEKLQAQLYVHSIPGHSTSFVIHLPLTIAVTDALLVRIGNDTYAIALTAVAHCVRTGLNDWEMLPGEVPHFKYQNALIPFESLHTILGSQHSPRSSDTITGVVLQANGRKCLLGVDEILGQRQIVIRSLEKNFRRLKYIASATHFGEDEIVFVLDQQAIISAQYNQIQTEKTQ
jgi:two-component system, chemotaxis family, sensor kinase CheA